MQMEFTSRGLLATFFRQQLKFWLVFLLVTAGAVYYITTARPLYQAAGSMLLRFGQNASPELAIGSGRAEEISQNDRREIIQSNIDLMYSHDLLRAVIEDVGVETIYPGITERTGGKDLPIEAAIRQLSQKHLMVKVGQSSTIIDVIVFNEDPAVAKKVADRLFAIYISRQSEVYNKSQIAFVQEQLTQARVKLEESQGKLQDFKSRTGVSSPDEEMNQLLKDKGDAANIALKSVDESQNRLMELQTKEAELLTTYRGDSPAVQTVRRSIALLRKQVKDRETDLQNNGGESNGLLSARLARIDERIAKLDGLRHEYNDLVRQSAMDEENYKNYQQRSEEARVNDNLNQQNITRVSIVDEPVPSARPVRPRKFLILAACLIAAGILALGTAALFETLDERYSTPSHVVRALQVPVLASFSGRKGR